MTSSAHGHMTCTVSVFNAFTQFIMGTIRGLLPVTNTGNIMDLLP